MIHPPQTYSGQYEMFPDRLCLRRTDPQCNMNRFYLMTVQRDLFGGACLVREWGRIGSSGQLRSEHHADEGQAVDALADIASRKRRRGYRVAQAAIQMAALPGLIVNRAFMSDFAAADAPCFAMGLVEADGQKTGFLAMRPDRAIPPEILGLGLAFGHRISGYRGEMLCQFVFNIYGFERYSALVNPAEPMVRQVLNTMVTQQDYFFFVLNPDGRANAFRSNLGQENLAGLSDTLPRMYKAAMPRTTYEEAVEVFRRDPDPPGPVLTWVCRNNPAYFDLDTEPMVLPPSG